MTARASSSPEPPVNWRLAARWCEQHGMDDQLCDDQLHDEEKPGRMEPSSTPASPAEPLATGRSDDGGAA